MYRRIGVLIMLICAGLAATSRLAASDTTAQSVTTHPRLFFDASEITALQAEAATTHQAIWRPIIDYAALVARDKPPESDYINRGNQLIPLAFACVISEDESICDATRDYLLAYTQTQWWSPAGNVDLEWAHVTQGIAIAYDWLYPRLTEDERRIIATGLSAHTQYLYETSMKSYRADWGNWWTKAYLQNHYAIIHSALGMAGLALWGETIQSTAYCSVTATSNVNIREKPTTDSKIIRALPAGESIRIEQKGTTGPEGFIWWPVTSGWVRSDVVSSPENCVPEYYQPDLWVRRAINRMGIERDFQNSISDGSWHESVLYQNYLLTNTLPFLVNLRRIQGTDLLPHTYLRQYSTWRVYNWLPDSVDAILAYGDFETTWGNPFAAQNILRFVASEYNDPYAEWLAQQLITLDPRQAGVYQTPWYVFEFLYYDPSILPQPPFDLPLARTFDDLEGVIWRESWAKDGLVFGLKTGPYGGRYAFESFVNGTYPWEVPCDETNCQLNMGHDHDDTNTFFLYRNQHWLATETIAVGNTDTTFHNTILIDGAGQIRPDGSETRLVEAFAGIDGQLQDTVDLPGFDYLISNATRRYADMTNVSRQVVYIRPDMLLMVDNLASASTHRYDWLCHFKESVTLEDNWLRGEAGGDQILGVGIVGPQPYTVETDNDGNPYARVTVTASDQRFIMLLFPTDSEGWDARPDFELLQDDGVTVAVRLHTDLPDQATVDVWITVGEVSAMRSAGPYAFDGQVAVITRDSADNMTGLFVYGGSAISYNGQVLARNLDHPLQLTRAGDSVEVSGTLSGPVELYAPGAKQITVNGLPAEYTYDGDYIRLGAPK